MMRTSTLVVLGVLMLAATCGAQSVPFYSGEATVFEPEVATAISGPILGATAITGADPRYVTLGVQTGVIGPPQLTPFSFAVSGNGFVGNGPSAGANSGNSQIVFGSPPPSAAPAAPTILDRPGMTLVSPLRQ